MYYVIDTSGKCVSICNEKPDDLDLESRGEFSVESGEVWNIGDSYLDGEFSLAEKTDSEKLKLFLLSVSNSLSICNSVGLQCYMTSKTFPSEWVTYREKLVELSATTEWLDSLVLPEQPDTPSGIII